MRVCNGNDFNLRRELLAVNFGFVLTSVYNTAARLWYPVEEDGVLFNNRYENPRLLHVSGLFSVRSKVSLLIGSEFAGFPEKILH